jgi:hypothetical protein
MTEGFIKLPRKLLQDPLWKSLSLEYRHIFLILLENMTFQAKKMNDHGQIINLKIGQILLTQRQLVELCDEATIDRSKIRRALDLFSKLDFSTHITTHTKTLITITHPAVCDLLNISHDPSFDPTSTQDRPLNKEIKKDKNIDKSNDLSFAESNKSDSKKYKIIFDFENQNWSGIQDLDLSRWKEIYPAISIEIELKKMREWVLSDSSAKSKKTWRKFINGWLNRANEKAINFAAAKATFKTNNQVDRRTKNPDGSPVSSPYDGAF